MAAAPDVVYFNCCNFFFSLLSALQMSHMYLSICLWTNLSFSIARLRVYLSRGRLADRVERQRTQHSALRVGRWRTGSWNTPYHSDSHVSQRTRAGHYGYIPLTWTSLNIPRIHKKHLVCPTWDKQVEVIFDKYGKCDFINATSSIISVAKIISFMVEELILSQLIWCCSHEPPCHTINHDLPSL